MPYSYSLLRGKEKIIIILLTSSASFPFSFWLSLSWNEWFLLMEEFLSSEDFDALYVNINWCTVISNVERRGYEKSDALNTKINEYVIRGNVWEIKTIIRKTFTLLRVDVNYLVQDNIFKHTAKLDKIRETSAIHLILYPFSFWILIDHSFGVNVFRIFLFYWCFFHGFIGMAGHRRQFSNSYYSFVAYKKHAFLKLKKRFWNLFCISFVIVVLYDFDGWK